MSSEPATEPADAAAEEAPAPSEAPAGGGTPAGDALAATEEPAAESRAAEPNGVSFAAEPAQNGEESPVNSMNTRQSSKARLSAHFNPEGAKTLGAEDEDEEPKPEPVRKKGTTRRASTTLPHKIVKANSGVCAIL